MKLGTNSCEVHVDTKKLNNAVYHPLASDSYGEGLAEENVSQVIGGSDKTPLHEFDPSSMASFR